MYDQTMFSTLVETGALARWHSVIDQLHLGPRPCHWLPQARPAKSLDPGSHVVVISYSRFVSKYCPQNTHTQWSRQKSRLPT